MQSQPTDSAEPAARKKLANRIRLGRHASNSGHAASSDGKPARHPSWFWSSQERTREVWAIKRFSAAGKIARVLINYERTTLPVLKLHVFNLFSDELATGIDLEPLDAVSVFVRKPQFSSQRARVVHDIDEIMEGDQLMLVDKRSLEEVLASTAGASSSASASADQKTTVSGVSRQQLGDKCERGDRASSPRGERADKLTAANSASAVDAQRASQ